LYDRQVVLPLELNTRVRCRWKDGEFYRCKVLERRIKPEYAGHPVDLLQAWEYYVHFSSSKSVTSQWASASPLHPQHCCTHSCTFCTPKKFWWLALQVLSSDPWEQVTQ
jgi:hypothetical protein